MGGYEEAQQRQVGALMKCHCGATALYNGLIKFCKELGGEVLKVSNYEEPLKRW